MGIINTKQYIYVKGTQQQEATQQFYLKWYRMQDENRIQNGPYSLLVRASYFISCSVHARFASILSINCKWRRGYRHF